MFVIAAAVFAADVAAVVLIVASIWLERSLGLSRGLILDAIFVVAISYGVAAWIAGKALDRGLMESRRRTREIAHETRADAASRIAS